MVTTRQPLGGARIMEAPAPTVIISASDRGRRQMCDENLRHAPLGCPVFVLSTAFDRGVLLCRSFRPLSYEYFGKRGNFCCAGVSTKSAND
ncbi:hypothetical protein GWI33_001309 [Rhynchophorus ferrugineus]|uniref:Uncharacterized protein n=1 Tax=Rhynchophorus ferrugineus TaxID=354439 RepID=A0A834IQJ4_RHYFE|nr:hypothetical protein GWI33_001309 [Rhynchophorus ferrugineus]